MHSKHILWPCGCCGYGVDILVGRVCCKNSSLLTHGIEFAKNFFLQIKIFTANLFKVSRAARP